MVQCHQTLASALTAQTGAEVWQHKQALRTLARQPAWHQSLVDQRKLAVGLVWPSKGCCRLSCWARAQPCLSVLQLVHWAAGSWAVAAVLVVVLPLV